MSRLQGLREGWREMRTQPALSAVAVLTLALGIGGATTMFATLRALLGSTVPPRVDATRVGRVAWANVDGLGRLPLTGEEFAAADPLMWASVAALLAGVAIGASALPAWRAVHVEPTVALRAE